MTRMVEPGARWLRCDLHVHTPFDGTRRFGEDLRGAIEAFKKEKTERLAAIAENFVEACRSSVVASALDLVALTDHNSIDGYRRLRPFFESIAQQANDEDRPMPVILPGVEFSVGGERPIHFLAIFALATPPDEIERAIQYVFGEREPFGSNGQPRATGDSVGTFLDRLYRYCRPPTGERLLRFVLLPAHADGDQGVAQETGLTAPPRVAPGLWEEMRGCLRQWAVMRTDWNGYQTSRPFERLPQAFQDLLLRWAAARRGEDWDQLTPSQKDRYRQQRHWPLVESSDPHAYQDVGSRFTWLKMAIPDVEGIRLALLDPESRLRRMSEGPPVRAYPTIDRIVVRNTDFIDHLELSLNPSLNTLIGGRGSGKSTVIELTRYALDRAKPEDYTEGAEAQLLGTVQRLLLTKPERDFGRTPGVLLNGTVVEVHVTIAGSAYRIRRSQEGIEVFATPDGSSPVPLDVRSLIAPRFLSQRQIASIAQAPAAQRRELDALLDPSWVSAFESRQSRLIDELIRLQVVRGRLRKRLDTLPARETDLVRTNDQIAFLEEGSRKETFDRFRAYQREQRWLQDASRELEVLATGLDEQAAASESASTAVGDPPDGPTRNWTGSLSERLSVRFAETAVTLRESAGTLRREIEAIASERVAEWQPGFEAAQGEYALLRDEMQARGLDFTQHERLLQQRALLEREVEELRTLDEEIERTKRDIRDRRAELVQVYEERFEERRARAHALEEADADIGLEIAAFRDRDSLYEKREEWLAGTGFQDRDWNVLVNFVFAPSGSVPERLQRLVDAFRQDTEATQSRGAVIDGSSSAMADLIGSEQAQELTGHFYRALQRGDRIRLDEMERFLPEDKVDATVRGMDGSFKPVESGSIGERSTAILSLVLSAGEQPLVIDQPEDDLDNQYVYNVVVDLLRKRKFTRQILVATHNANIPVNGDAELIIALDVADRMGTVLETGSIDSEKVKEHVSVIMEGSAEAFRLRRDRYGY